MVAGVVLEALGVLAFWYLPLLVSTLRYPIYHANRRQASQKLLRPVAKVGTRQVLFGRRFFTHALDLVQLPGNQNHRLLHVLKYLV